MEKTEIMNNLKKRMEGAISSLDHDLKGLRTGRASANLLDPVVVEAYGDRMSINQLATVTAPEARLIIVQVWDTSLTKTIEKAIANAGLGVNPVGEGQTIKIALPSLSEERRKELVKLASKYGENAKVAIRNVRRDIMDIVKKMEKDKEISEDESRKLSDDIQKTTDDYIKKIDANITTKEHDILNV